MVVDAAAVVATVVRTVALSTSGVVEIALLGKMTAPGGGVAKPFHGVVVQVTPSGQSGIGTQTVGQGVVVVVEVVMEVNDAVVTDVSVVVVPVGAVWEVSVILVTEVHVVPVVVVVVSVTGGGAERMPKTRDRKTTMQRDQGTHHTHHDLCLGTLIMSYWPPMPTYLYSVVGLNCPLPPPTYAMISPSLSQCAHPGPSGVCALLHPAPPHQLVKPSQWRMYGE